MQEHVLITAEELSVNNAPSVFSSQRARSLDLWGGAHHVFECQARHVPGERGDQVVPLRKEHKVQ